jgi:HD-GYP domain-containing protein (c-di-GMP phosphodiesterase class II)
VKIDLEQLIQALSDTVDLVGVDEVQHSKRVACMALVCAETMGLSQQDAAELYHIGLLHDCGVSTTRVHRKLIDELDWKDSFIHCQIGAKRMQQFLPLAPMADVILHHHTKWEQLQKLHLPQETQDKANLIFLLDRIDALCSLQNGPNRLAGKDAVCDKVVSLRDIYFKSELVDIFLAAAENEAFWIALEPFQLADFLNEHKPESRLIDLTQDDLRSVAALFAQIVDAKSSYTAEHSCGVAMLSRFLAQKSSLTESQCCKVEVAGLLHDLGKLQIPDTVLERKGSLNKEEVAVMRHHSYVTYQILKKIQGLEDITLWAAYHHEKLDGSGYPFRKTAEDLSIESRLIIVADIFQALAQQRPYRSSLSLEVILDFIRAGSKSGLLDSDVVKLVESESPECYRIATAT